jgi:rhamnosyltransferase
VDYEGVNIRQKNIDGVKTEVSACMTSGSLTNLSAWKKVLGFKDSYFIDFVDNEFCMKLILNGYKIIRVNNCVMHHQLGDTVKIKLFYFFNVTATRHRPWRLYYMTRNNLLFIWEYKAHLGIIREYAKFGLILFNNLIYSDNRRDTWRYIRRGIIDAVKHKEGKMPL